MQKNLKMIRGDTFAFAIEIEGLEQDLDTSYFSCKKNIDSEEYTFQKSLENGIEKIEEGKYRIRVAPEDTKGKDTGIYYYDLQIGVNGDVHTVLRGQLTIEPEITEE